MSHALDHSAEEVNEMAKKNNAFILMALKTSANHIGSGLLNAVADANQPTDVALSNIVAALKTGVVAAGQEIARERLSKLI
jgi:hypothetical protein